MNKKIIASAVLTSILLSANVASVNATPKAKEWAEKTINNIEDYIVKNSPATCKNIMELDTINDEVKKKMLDLAKKSQLDFTAEEEKVINQKLATLEMTFGEFIKGADEIKAKYGEDLKKFNEENLELKKVLDNNASTEQEIYDAYKKYSETMLQFSDDFKNNCTEGKDTFEKFIKDQLAVAKKELDEANKKAPAPVSTGGGSSGGGGYYAPSSVTTVETKKVAEIVTNNLTPADAHSGILFPNFKKSSAELVSSLNDPRLLAMQKQFGAETTETKNKPLTRGEFLSMVIDTALVDVSKVDTSKLAFTDVKKDEKLAKYIAFAVSKNIISGYDNNTFRADNTISRAEATKILVEAIGMKPRDKQTQFTDVLPLNTLGGYIQTAYNNKLIHGTSLTTFEPNRTISKAELIKILFNITVSK